MSDKPDSILAACLRLTTSADAMRAAAKTYQRLADQSPDPKSRKAFVECAAFYAQLAEWSGDNQQPPLNRRGMNGLDG